MIDLPGGTVKTCPLDLSSTSNAVSPDCPAAEVNSSKCTRSAAIPAASALDFTASISPFGPQT